MHRSSDFAICFESAQDAHSGSFEVCCHKLCSSDDKRDLDIVKKENVTLKVGATGPGTIQFQSLLQSTWDLKSAIGFAVGDAFFPCFLTLVDSTSRGVRPRVGNYVALTDWNSDSGLEI